jgi:hypothetical protein
MVANLPEKVQGKAEEARNLISTINSGQEESSSGAASELMSSVVGRLKETGLANEVFEMSNAEIEDKLIELGLDAETTKQVAAWHGSPHSFDRFTTEAMGTGEGAQAFGWGLYFTDSESIARHYARKLSNNQNEFTLKDWIYGNIEYISYSDLESFDDFKEIGNLFYKNQIESIEIKYKETQDSYYEIALKSVKEDKNKFDSLDFKKASPNLYKVSLQKDKTPDQYTWLEWDKEISKNNLDMIISQLKKEKLYNALYERYKKLNPSIASELLTPEERLKSADGNEIYPMLSEFLDSPKETSLFLLRAGIDGIKYPAESISRGATSDTARGFNYVVFDENAVTIEEQIRFQKTRSIESRGGQRGTRFESAVAPESIVKFFNINTMGNTLDTKDAMETLSAISNYIDLDVSITSPTYSELQAFVEQLNNKIDSGSVDFSIIEEETGVTQKDIEKFLGTAEKRLASFEARNNIQFQTQPLSDKGINLTTAGFVYNGDVYLNMDNMNLDTPIHEFGHLWLSWAKNNLGEAYARGLELAKSSEADPYRQYVMDTQPDLAVDSNEFLEEVLAQAIGDNGARLIEENSTKTKSWLQDLWDAIGKMLGISELVANGGYETLTLNEYTKAVAVDLFSGKKFSDTPLSVTYNNDLNNNEKVIVNPDGHNLSYVKESDLIDITSLIKDISENNQKVWFWVADQLGRGIFTDDKTGDEHFLDAGPSFALDPENRKDNIIWASGMKESRINENLKNSDYIFIISGSPVKSKLFNKAVFKLFQDKIGDYNTFKTQVLSSKSTKGIKEVLNAHNSWESLIEDTSTDNLPKKQIGTGRKKMLLEILNSFDKPNSSLYQILNSRNAVIDINSLRDGFYSDNNFDINDIMLVLKGDKLGGKSSHSTYEKNILGEVVGVPDKKINAFDILTKEYKEKLKEKDKDKKSQQQQIVAPYGTGIKEILPVEETTTIPECV